MKRILLFIASLSGGGAERVMSQIASELAEAGYEVHLATWSGAQRNDFYTLDQRVTRHELGSHSTPRSAIGRALKGIGVLFAMRRVLRDVSPDSVLSFIDRTNIMVAVAALGTGVRVVVSERVDPASNDTLPIGWRIVRPWAYRWCDLLVVQTRSVAAWVARAWGIKARVIPNVLRAMPAPDAEREQVIVSIGRLVPQKGFEMSIEAFSRLAKRYPGWRYIVLGDGPLRQELESLGTRLDLGPRLEFKGVVADVDNWLAKASICVQPSRFEGFPNAVMEAMAMGVATISTDCDSGPRDLITDGVDGMLVPVGEVDALTAALDSLMADDALRQTIARSALSIRERLDRRRVMDQWIEALLG
jgi:GalNAc-alpha-(1->4)-GalNAc-alpha-(1->3)-diNAcBac-PP-undecaprenol alpha-1,4-N-acetyl-D-galactosaminyltransferase